MRRAVQRRRENDGRVPRQRRRLLLQLELALDKLEREGDRNLDPADQRSGHHGMLSHRRVARRQRLIFVHTAPRRERTPNSKPVCRPVACGRRSIARAPTDALRSVNIELSADRCSPICAELMLQRPKLELKATDPRKNFRAPIDVLRSVHQDSAPIDSHRSGPMLVSTDRWP